MKPIVIAIDGYSGTGKSSTAKQVASRLQYNYVDSGAMYRCVTKYFLENDIDLGIPEAVEIGLGEIGIHFEFNRTKGSSEVFLNDVCVENEIRSQRISDHVSQVAAISAVRRKMVQMQRDLGVRKEIVMDGRDIGTVVFPHAELKIFMTTSIDVRASRRFLELQEKGLDADLTKIKANLEERDHLDTTREDSPLVKAEGAIELDTSHLTFEEQVQKIVDLANLHIHEG